ncbi:MAG: threonylcarbamoyl-AMP synthase [Clostridia bacterium]|nr:threonylcarbamoyl-AMP synthase [Clostridia bacterium]
MAFLPHFHQTTTKRDRPALNTKLLPVSPESIAEAGEIIRAGGLEGFPTETVYGLGANALDGNAVRRLFEAKGRPGDNPLITHVASEEEIAPLITGDVSPAARALMDAFWPGPMTLIFPKSDAIPPEVSAGLSTVGIRMPSHPAARALIRAAQRPIAAPSANRSGRPSPTTARHVLDDMDGRIPLILDGGPCEVGVESTVIDVTGDVPRVLRPGGVTPEMIAKACGAVEVDGAVMRPLKEGEQPRSPGMKYRHYAPEGDLTIFEGENGAVAAAIRARYDAAPNGSAAILALPGHEALYGARRVFPLGAADTAESVAAALFALLRRLDDERVKHIFSEAVDASGVGLAVIKTPSWN